MRVLSSISPSVVINTVKYQHEYDLRKLCSFLSSTVKWTIGDIYLPRATEEGWSTLAEVMPLGSVICYHVTEEAVKTARPEHIKKLWEATKGAWWNLQGFWSHGEFKAVKIANKIEGDDGLAKVLT